MASLFSQHEGFLPYFLLYVRPLPRHEISSPVVPAPEPARTVLELMPKQTSASALIQAAVCYCAVPHKALVFFGGSNAPPPHGLLARLYGLQNTYAALITLYAAYHITNSELYTLAALTYAGTLFLAITEVLFYKTVGIADAIHSLATRAAVLSWMWMYRDFYLA
ncbi:hypothetical protein GQ53DRAFT_824653 [Thozetella sp. PMI_491]|nr:hypothetical protein GQ53DRAFT_824653 [Thozetella sp. PMI_491]